MASNYYGSKPIKFGGLSARREAGKNARRDRQGEQRDKDMDSYVNTIYGFGKKMSAGRALRKLQQIKVR